MWLPDWPLQRLYVARPELKSRPVVLYQGGGRRGSTVVLCSPQAWQRGLRPGMPLAEATGAAVPTEQSARRAKSKRRAQPDRSSDLHLELYDPGADRAALIALAEWCERYSPVVGIEESSAPEASCDTLLAEVGGCAHLFGGEEPLLVQVGRELRARGYEPRVALADTIGAAWAAARCDPRAQKEGAVIPPGAAPARLGAWPIVALRLSPETTTTLHELGVEVIEQLGTLDRGGLAARLGAEVLTRLDQALGRRDEVIRGLRGQPPLQMDWCFESPVERRDMIESALEAMLARLAVRLKERGQGVEQLVCRLYLASGESVSMQIGTVRPRSSATHLLELLRLPLEQARLTAPVMAVRVRATLTAAAWNEQRQMFDGVQAQGQERLAKLWERLAGRLGPAAVVRPKLLGDPQPERGFRYEPVVATAGQKRRSATAQRKRTPPQPSNIAPAHLPARPLVLLARPLRAQVWMVVPQGPVARFRCALAEERIARSWGPERIETGWWRGTAVRRDYYQVETASGRRYWLYCRLRDARWFVHGLFE